MYTDEERRIYAYSDGRSTRKADPLALESAYFEALASQDQAGLSDQLRSPIRPIRAAAEARLLTAIRKAFGVVEFDERTGEGLPMAETFALSREFFAWKARIRRKYRRDARDVAVYGFAPGRAVDYEMRCGLSFNNEMAASISAVAVARGIVSALTGKPHPSLVNAMAETEAQVGTVQLMVDSEREEAEQLARMESGQF